MKTQCLGISLLLLGTLGLLSSVSIKAQAEDLTVQASLSGCILDITVYPERRIPPTGNWDTILEVFIYNEAESLVAQFTTNTNTSGLSSTDLCAMNIYPSGGNYNFYLRGFSHLRKRFPNKTAFTVYSTNLNLSTDGELLAGETSIVYDNYINTLDLSVIVNRIFSTDYKNDLNQDGEVNSLDISIMIKNLFGRGE